MKRYLKLPLAISLLIIMTQCGDSDDPKKNLPSLSINDATGVEGGNATFTVTLSAPSTDAVTFSFKTENVTASSTDYGNVPDPQTMTIVAGQTTIDIIIPLVQDAEDEPSEKFNVILSDPVNAQLSDKIIGIGTITNGPPPFFVTMSIGGSAWTANENQSEPVLFVDEFAGYGTGTFSDSQLSVEFNKAPTGAATYTTDPTDGSDATKVRIYYAPTFTSTGGLGTTYKSQTGGQLILTKYDATKGIAEGTFHFTGKNESNQTLEFTGGSFRVKVE